MTLILYVYVLVRKLAITRCYLKCKSIVKQKCILDENVWFFGISWILLIIVKILKKTIEKIFIIWGGWKVVAILDYKSPFKEDELCINI